ncbi:hypothetical protein GLAREA_07622 [Glarea lozoyensis ATCC 20868]|uniref:Transcription factor domain-containing protein n=1 Tax=Glarea lozoyensis (strain ATCC 20868 / MF5171) TaxID=1116229 RepID=S3D5S9_GLAL2|nr:uncharacterized protein GLAREA_07622 [Glarea lozoyensis ATCC 20868]EPE32489.1 hypothetical protein GLAREA_07622 [Glarea lozoyensis ATCC 20868]
MASDFSRHIRGSDRSTATLAAHLTRSSEALLDAPKAVSQNDDNSVLLTDLTLAFDLLYTLGHDVAVLLAEVAISSASPTRSFPACQKHRLTVTGDEFVETDYVVHAENAIHSTSFSTSSLTLTSPTRHTHAYKEVQVLSPSATEDEETGVSKPSHLEPQCRTPTHQLGHQDSTPANSGAFSLYGIDTVDRSNDLSGPECLNIARPNYTALSYPGIPYFITDHSMKSKLIFCYFNNVSHWCELADSLQTFSALHGRLVVQSSCFGSAALAVSARFLENTANLHESSNLSSQLYEYARLLLQGASDNRSAQLSNNASFLLTTVVLSLYCAMTFQAEDLRTQLRSYINKLQLHTWEGPLSLTSIACFWALARLDVWAAYQCRQSTLIHKDLWHRFSSANTNNVQDHWANRVIFIFSRIVNQVRHDHCAPGTLQELWEALESWVISRPECMKPVLELEIGENDAFPVILFSNSSAVCGNIFYHTSCILLLQTSQLQPFPRALVTISNPLCHARRVGAISISNDPNQWINNIEPIAIAAQHYMRPEEQIVILKHLREIRTCTGWETANKSRLLRKHWGLE